MRKLEIKKISKEIAKNLKKENEGIEYLKKFSSIFKEKPICLSLLSNPLIPYEERKKTLQKAMEILELPKATKTIILALFKTYLLKDLQEIINEIEKEALKLENVMFFDVYIPEDYSEKTKEKIKIFLEKKFKKKIKVNFKIKEDLIGGFEAFSESYQYIFSIKGALEKFSLKEEEIEWI